jgi:hypothetical protein
MNRVVVKRATLWLAGLEASSATKACDPGH